ncbi:non-heme iron oxygenase ferredoxin subunit [Piscinibacter sp.]|uniref:non-heme iron oxygenase ferredoxin subunit n=1 Tax=Piscinibacter sp. TaxID=1903157 RepID=UPI002C87203D|nr:non-heme iron oxygenase ferredoxin subunit [Albitalea sp.]HUG22297.1 non-heme iron oxygenase ferredoxin subunit [Albitalea sp.]
MAEWVAVARVEDFPPGTVRTLEIEGTPIAVFNVDGRYHAIEDLCSHEAETLSDGELAGDEIICPRHGARFSILSGQALSPPAYEPVATFPVQVERGMVLVKDDRWN